MSNALRNGDGRGELQQVSGVCVVCEVCESNFVHDERKMALVSSTLDVLSDGNLEYPQAGKKMMFMEGPN